MFDPLDIVGVKYKTIEVIEYLIEVSNPGSHFYKCVCNGCGGESTKLRERVLKKGGCLICIATKHGRSGTPEHNAWKAMKRRCYLETDKAYKNYGGRGIIVCDRWLESFMNFYEDMGDRPSKNHSLDRINNEGNYEASNCKWSTTKEQGRNKRNITLDEELVKKVKRLKQDWDLRPKEIAEKLNIELQTVFNALNKNNWKDI